jgi:hypothetical protein
MKTAILMLASLVPAFAIDGWVINRTTGMPAANAPVSFFKIDQGGMEPEESVRTDAQGKFAFQKDADGPRLIQATFDGVTYSHMAPPGTPGTNLTMDVYNASKQPGSAKVSQHLFLLEPGSGQVNVTEAFIYLNDGKTTYNDPSGGTVHFYLPPAAKGVVQVNCTAPQGMPVQRSAEKSNRADVYKVDFPIKPGETRVDLRYMVPLAADGAFEGKTLFRGQGVTRMATPQGVTLAGDSIRSLGSEPQTNANIYEVNGNDFKVTIAGSGSLNQQQNAPAQDSGPQIDQVLPRIFRNVIPILALAFGILALGFILLYRAVPKAAAAEGKHEQRRRR